MSLIKSVMLPLATPAPTFELLNTVDGTTQSLETLKGENGTLIIFMCNHCPYVVHILEELVKTANKIQANKINVIAISSNFVVSHPQDGPTEMKKLAHSYGFAFPYLYDETQAIAKTYKATCTPDLFLFDGMLKLFYRGRFDDSTPGNNRPVSGADISNACDMLVAKKHIVATQYPSMGCSIKWAN